MSSKKDLKPVKSSTRDSMGQHYWKCPKCGSWVGGFVMTMDMGRIDTRYHQDTFCERCGIKINWNL